MTCAFGALTPRSWPLSPGSLFPSQSPRGLQSCHLLRPHSHLTPPIPWPYPAPTGAAPTLHCLTHSRGVQADTCMCNSQGLSAPPLARPLQLQAHGPGGRHAEPSPGGQGVPARCGCPRLCDPTPPMLPLPSSASTTPTPLLPLCSRVVPPKPSGASWVDGLLQTFCSEPAPREGWVWTPPGAAPADATSRGPPRVKFASSPAEKEKTDLAAHRPRGDPTSQALKTQSPSGGWGGLGRPLPLPRWHCRAPSCHGLSKEGGSLWEDIQVCGHLQEGERQQGLPQGFGVLVGTGWGVQSPIPGADSVQAEKALLSNSSSPGMPGLSGPGLHGVWVPLKCPRARGSLSPQRGLVSPQTHVQG